MLAFITTSYAQPIYGVVSGNSMYPTYKDGDVVKVTAQDNYKDGDVVVADVGGKKVIKRINGDILEGDNKSNTARYDLKTADILGKAEYKMDEFTEEEKKRFNSVFASRIEMVDAGDYFTVALRSDGTVWTWGRNESGQLGNTTNIGTNNANRIPTQVAGLSGVIQISAGGSHAVALKSDGTVYAWGTNRYGQLGNTTNSGTTNSNATPLQVTDLTGVSQISAGEIHTVALKNDGTVWAWGINGYGQLGNPTNVGTSNTNVTPLQVTGLTGVSQVSAGDGHTVALMGNGTVYAWGDNYSGQLGNSTNDGTENANAVPLQVTGLTGVSQLSAGYNHTIALKSDGTVYAWGSNSFGCLGDNTTTKKVTPTKVHGVGNVDFLTGVSQVSAGENYTVALKSDGTAYAWGYNIYGQLGNHTNVNLNPNSTPLQITGLTEGCQVSAGKFHTVVLKIDGTLRACGHNLHGPLGNASNSGTNNSNPSTLQVLKASGTAFLAIVDITPPTAAITYSMVGPYKAGTTITITVTFDEPVVVSPVPQLSISGANNVTNTNMTKVSTTEYTYTHTVGTGNGGATVALATAQDAEGNVVTAAPTSGATFEVDNTAPIVPTFTPSTTDWTNQDITVTINYPEDSTIRQYKVGAASWQAYTGVLTITINSTLYARCYDASGNLSNQSTLSIVNIDKTPPNAPTVDPGTGTYNAAQTVTVSNTSGDVAHTYYTTDGTDPDNTDTEVQGGTLIVDGNNGDTVTLKLVSYDGINKGAISIPYLYTFNKTGPIITANPIGRTKSPDNINVNITITSDNLNNWQYQWDTDTTLDENNWEEGDTNPKTVEQNTDGTWYLHVRAEDDDENIITQTYGTYKKGTVSPSDGYADDTYADEKKYFKYYVGLDANNIGRVMLAAPKDVGGVK